jgi:capsular exopolysaccharide synthesis family protein
MSILKALQKKKMEHANGRQPGAPTVVTNGTNGRSANMPPEMFVNGNVKIGKSSLASTEQADSLIGKALPDWETKKTAGATLDAIGSTRSTKRDLPAFAEWDVEVERVEPRLVAIRQPHSNYCEEYRSLRTHILHKSQRQKLQSIVVASVNPSEGKSVTSLNFSWLLAQTDGVSALIIDADLRLPSLTDYLAIETEKGLSHMLEGNATLNESIIKLNPAGLHLLPGGEARSNVAELISGPTFKEILRQAREMFDFVIIDAPPLGIFTDAAVLINHADGAMIVVRAGKTRYSVLDRTLETLPKDRLLGVVLNQSEDVLDESNYDYGYYKASRRLGV